jgi:hypothetical protein
MIFEYSNLANELFNDLISYEDYVEHHNLHNLLDIDLNTYGAVEAKQDIADPYYTVNPKLTTAFAPELDDLCRLHHLVTSRKVTTILEFGLGKSTIIFNDALQKNRINYSDLIKKTLRRSNAFECHSVDNYEKWINEVKLKYTLENITYYHTSLLMDTFNDRACTYYQCIPNVCPDFIYLDGPDQFSVVGDVRGITTNHPDRLPMAADILVLEHFLLPGTLLVVDGRTANARFLKANLQRDWVYFHDENADQHYFELNEKPLGIYNRRQIDFCLGETYYTRLRNCL